MEALRKVAINTIALDIDKIIFEILSNKELQAFIVRANRFQLLEGKDSLGVKLSDIGGEYSEFTLKLHPEKVKDKVTLFDTGEMHKSIKVKLSPGLFEMEADTIKEGRDLELDWGENIIGVPEEKKDIIYDKIKDEIIRITRQRILER